MNQFQPLQETSVSVEPQQSQKIYRCWTDGSTKPKNPGPGGWAFLLTHTDSNNNVTRKARYGSNPYTSNIRMELVALLRALQYLTELKEPAKIFVFTDSQYIIDGFRNLRRNKLLKSHYDVWGLLLFYSQLHTVSPRKVKAHAGIDGNEYVDRLAKRAAERQTGDIFMSDLELMMAKKLFGMKKVEMRSWER